MFDFLSRLSSSGEEKKRNDIFHDGMKYGVAEGIRIGMEKHFTATSELTEEENELLRRFLVINNFVLCYDSMLGGFRVRKNDTLNPQKEKTVYVVDGDYVTGETIKYASVSFIESQLLKMDIEKNESERIKKQINFNIFKH